MSHIVFKCIKIFMCLDFICLFVLISQLNGSNGECTNTDDHDMPRKANILNYGSNGREDPPVGGYQPRQHGGKNEEAQKQRLLKEVAELKTAVKAMTLDTGPPAVPKECNVIKPVIVAKGGGSKELKHVRDSESEDLAGVWKECTDSGPLPVVPPPPPALLKPEDPALRQSVLVGALGRTSAWYSWIFDYAASHWKVHHTLFSTAMAGVTVVAHAHPIVAIPSACCAIAAGVKAYYTQDNRPYIRQSPELTSSGITTSEKDGDWTRCEAIVETNEAYGVDFRNVFHEKVEEQDLIDLYKIGYRQFHRIEIHPTILDYLRRQNAAVNKHSFGGFKQQLRALEWVSKVDTHIVDRTVMVAVQRVQLTQFRSSQYLSFCEDGRLVLNNALIK